MKRVYLCKFLCILFLVQGLTLPALEITQGRVRLVIHERFERFIPYLRFPETSSAGETWVPLISDRDPRTSYTTLFVNNQAFRLGDLAGIRAQIEQRGQEARIRWLLPLLEVKMSFSFLRSEESAESDALKIVLEVQNTSDAEVTLGVRYTLDTYLGEGTSTTFRTPLIPGITRESSFSPSTENWYLITEEPVTNRGLLLLLGGEGITPVEEVVIANWKRLQEATWKYSVNPTRTFTYLPYSINDAAVALYYPVHPIVPGSVRRIVTVLGAKSSGRFQKGVAPIPDITNLLAPRSLPPEGQEGGDLRTLQIEELKRLEEFIDRLSQRSVDSTPLTREELELYRKVLEEFSERAKALESKSVP